MAVLTLRMASNAAHHAAAAGADVALTSRSPAKSASCPAQLRIATRALQMIAAGNFRDQSLPNKIHCTRDGFSNIHLVLCAHLTIGAFHNIRIFCHQIIQHLSVLLLPHILRIFDARSPLVDYLSTNIRDKRRLPFNE